MKALIAIFLAIIAGIMMAKALIIIYDVFISIAFVIGMPASDAAELFWLLILTPATFALAKAFAISHFKD